MRALVFHPSGKYLLSASDDKTLRVWDLATGRCVKTVDAHGHFVTTLAWGRATVGGGGGAGAGAGTGPGGAGPGAGGGDGGEKDNANGSGAGKDEPRRINVIATGSVDQTIKVSAGRQRVELPRLGPVDRGPEPSARDQVTDSPDLDTIAEPQTSVCMRDQAQ